MYGKSLTLKHVWLVTKRSWKEIAANGWSPTEQRREWEQSKSYDKGILDVDSETGWTFEGKDKGLWDSRPETEKPANRGGIFKEGQRIDVGWELENKRKEQDIGKLKLWVDCKD